MLQTFWKDLGAVGADGRLDTSCERGSSGLEGGCVKGLGVGEKGVKCTSVSSPASLSSSETEPAKVGGSSQVLLLLCLTEKQNTVPAERPSLSAPSGALMLQKREEVTAGLLRELFSLPPARC